MTTMAKKSKLQQFVEAALAEIKGPRKGRPVADVFDLDDDSAVWALSTSWGNRDPRPKHVSRLRVAMTSDETWNFDGDALSWLIDDDGAPRLFEGHHRCEARILSKSGFNPLVTITIGSRPKAQETRGDKQKWAPRDHSTARGYPAKSGELTAALIRAITSVHGEIRGRHVDAVAAVCADGLRYLGEKMSTHARLSHSNAIGGMLLAWPSDPVRVQEFADIYFSEQFGKEHPAGLLRQWTRDHGKLAGLSIAHRIKLLYRAATSVGLFCRGINRKALVIDGPAVAKMTRLWQPLAEDLGVEIADPVKWLRDHRDTVKDEAE